MGSRVEFISMDSQPYVYHRLNPSVKYRSLCKNPTSNRKNILLLNPSKATELQQRSAPIFAFKCLTHFSVSELWSTLFPLPLQQIPLQSFILLSTPPPYWSEAPSSPELDQNRLTPHRRPPRRRPSRWCRRSLSVWTSTTAAKPLWRWGEAAQHRWLLQEVGTNEAAHVSSATARIS